MSVRGSLYGSAKSLGDLNAIGKRAIGQRIGRRSLGALSQSPGMKGGLAVAGVMWYGGQVKSTLNLDMVRKLNRIGRKITSEIRKRLNKTLPKELVGRRTFGTNNNYPYKRTGRLRDAVKFVVNPYLLYVDIGVLNPAACPYAYELEVGSDRIQPRAYIRRTISEYRQWIINVLHTPIKKTMKRYNLRGILYAGGAMMGDVEALGSGSVGSRITSRVVGRESGFGISGLMR